MIKMKPLERVEALLTALLNETRTMCALNRSISGFTYGSLRITEIGKKPLNTMIG